MYYHVRISLKSQKSEDETKTDLTSEQLNVKIIAPYELGESFIINGKTIKPDDIDRIRISRSEESISEIINRLTEEDGQSNIIHLGGHSYHWRAASKAKEVTDELILGLPGYKKSNQTKKDTDVTPNKNSIFVVHGHDDELKNDLDIFLRDIGLEPIILHRQIDEGLTIVEKFEKHSDVGYAFILLTPDDMATTVKKYNDNNQTGFEFRARQNVIFEFGYFVGKLGRKNVCCIYKKGVVLPNDVLGLLYKQIDKTINSIGYELIKELQAANISLQLK